MAYTITQARPLLTAAELELFDQSRAAPIKALTLARLRGKVARTRALRDKYRDLYRRQTVSVRKTPGGPGRTAAGTTDNERTQRKADILQEVLTRFEDRLGVLEAQQARDAAAPAGKPAAARKTRHAAPAKVRSTRVSRSTASGSRSGAGAGAGA